MDSMRVPFIFLFKMILDYLIDFLNMNYDMKSLVDKQRNFNIILGLLQNEVLPFYLKISIFNAMYYLHSIMNCGDIASSSCFASEHSYMDTRHNTYSCGSPVKNAFNRLTMRGFLSAFEIPDIEDIPFPEYTEFDSYIVVIDQNFSVELNKDILISIAKCNLYDEYMYFVDSSYSRNTFLDELLTSEIGINYDDINNNVNKYLENHPISVDITNTSPILYELAKSDDNPKITLEGELFYNNKLYDKRIAYTRTKEGRIVAFYIIGFIDFNVEGQSYMNVLCLKIPTRSGSSCVWTTTNGFLNTKQFMEELNQPKIYMISNKRLHLGQLQTYENENYKDGDSYITNKLIIRQYNSFGDTETFRTIESRRKESTSA